MRIRRHPKSGARIGRQRQVAPPEDRGLVKQLHVLGRHQPRQPLEQLGRVQLIALEAGHQLLECHALEQRGELLRAAHA